MSDNRTVTEDLVTWLRAQLDDDERVAREAVGPVGSRWKAEGCRVEVDGDTKGHDVFEWTVCFDEGAPSGEQAEHIARHNPARVLAEVDAKRQILDEHQPFPQPQRMATGETIACSTCGSVDDSPVEWPCPTLRLLAQPYAHRPGYRDEWRP